MQQDVHARRQSLWQGALRLAVDSIAGLTAVDGATVISDQYALLAFGAKIGLHSFPTRRSSDLDRKSVV